MFLKNVNSFLHYLAVRLNSNMEIARHTRNILILKLEEEREFFSKYDVYSETE